MRIERRRHLELSHDAFLEVYLYVKKKSHLFSSSHEDSQRMDIKKLSTHLDLFVLCLRGGHPTYNIINYELVHQSQLLVFLFMIYLTTIYDTYLELQDLSIPSLFSLISFNFPTLFDPKPLDYVKQFCFSFFLLVILTVFYQSGTITGSSIRNTKKSIASEKVSYK